MSRKINGLKLEICFSFYISLIFDIILTSLISWFDYVELISMYASGCDILMQFPEYNVWKLLSI